MKDLGVQEAAMCRRRYAGEPAGHMINAGLYTAVRRMRGTNGSISYFNCRG